MEDREDHIRLYARNCLGEDKKILWNVPNLLLQKFPAPKFEVTTKMEFSPELEEDQAGLVIMGIEYAYLVAKKTKDNQLMLSLVKGNGPQGEEREVARTDIDANAMYFRVTVNEGGRCIFSYSLDGEDFIKIGDEFIAKEDTGLEPK